jgi:NADH dehydrogenase
MDPTSARILLIEGGPRLLAAYPEKLSESAKEQLEAMGVHVRLNSRVTGIEFGAVFVGEERIPAYNVVWSAGVSASPLGKTLGAPVDRMGRVVVEPDLSVPGHPEVFVVGDLAAFNHQLPGGEPLAGVAQVAIQGGEAAARNIARTIRGEPRVPFHYHDKGSMATIGRAKAIAQIGRFQLSGFIAWLVWIFVHILFLIGFRNRATVMLEWAWSYLSWERGALLITGEVRPDTVRSRVEAAQPPWETRSGWPRRSPRESCRSSAPSPAGCGGRGWVSSRCVTRGRRRGERRGRSASPPPARPAAWCSWCTAPGTTRSSR